MNKCSSLSGSFVGYKEKKFYKIGPWLHDWPIIVDEFATK
jgi:hypothetical protein